MSGTRKGGLLAAQKNKELYGENFYKKIGSAGGKASGTGGFYYMKYTRGNFEAIKAAGRKGGTISKRVSTVVSTAHVTAKEPVRAVPVKHWYDFIRRKR